MLPFSSSAIEKVLTLSDDLPHPITTQDIPFYTCNFHCYDNPVKYGPAGTQNGTIFPNDICWMRNANLRDYRFKNYTAGLNGVIVAEMTVPTDFVIKHLRL
jgi:hypothetical protein